MCGLEGFLICKVKVGFKAGLQIRVDSQSPADDNPLVLRRLEELLVLFARSFEEVLREIESGHPPGPHTQEGQRKSARKRLCHRRL